MKTIFCSKYIFPTALIKERVGSNSGINYYVLKEKRILETQSVENLKKMAREFLCMHVNEYLGEEYEVTNGLLKAEGKIYSENCPEYKVVWKIFKYDWEEYVGKIEKEGRFAISDADRYFNTSRKEPTVQDFFNQNRSGNLEKIIQINIDWNFIDLISKNKISFQENYQIKLLLANSSKFKYSDSLHSDIYYEYPAPIIPARQSKI